jgi:hypothetical protein
VSHTFLISCSPSFLESVVKEGHGVGGREGTAVLCGLFLLHLAATGDQGSGRRLKLEDHC